MTRTTGRMPRRVLVSALSLLFGSAAQAGFYPGHIDPGGLGDIPGYTADAVFSIDPSCTTDGTAWKATNALVSSGCGNASLYSAIVYLYTTDPGDPPNPGIVKDHFTLTDWPVLGVYFQDGALAGIDTNRMGPAYGLDPYPPYDGRPFWLQFWTGLCEYSGCTPPGGTVTVTLAAAGDPGSLSVDNINHFSLGDVRFGPECPDPTTCLVPSIPEPGTLALLFGALGGGWLARRRKRDASA